MVTGAGGSIGTELCRQILAAKPRVLVLVEHSEYALYGISDELSHQPLVLNGQCKIVPTIANVTNEPRMLALCRAHKPSCIFHAAAYKHVPLVEENVAEGVFNNVFGTLATVRAALSTEVPCVVLISTDKAVRPTNVMGASKRVAEMILQALCRRWPGHRNPPGCDALLHDNLRSCRTRSPGRDHGQGGRGLSLGYGKTCANH